MYIRFVTGQFDRDSGLDCGFFQSTYGIRHNRWEIDPWLRAEISRSLDWFEDHMEEPERFDPTSRKRRGHWGVCWFRPEAKRHLREAHHMAWLLNEAGIPVHRVRARNPGEIVWQDDHQIVAIKNRTGTVFV